MFDLTFSSLEVEGWRQFDDVQIELHPRLTIITGANGSGKSTLLSILNRHFGYNKNYLSTPLRRTAGGMNYSTGILTQGWHTWRVPRMSSPNVAIGKIIYSNKQICTIFAPSMQSPQYGLSTSNQQPVQGVHIDSYRPVPVYNQVGSIPLQPMTANQAYLNYNNEVLHRYNNLNSGFSPIYRMKEAMISMAAFGEGNSTLGQDTAIFDAFKSFNGILKSLLPSSLGFERISVRIPDVVLVTKSGDFLIDAASGGIMTLLDIAWRIHLFSIEAKKFAVTMDEPENHLHPAMQRSLMGKLIEAFPHVQFIVATHSPFIVSSVKDSNVYVLRYEDETGSENFGLRPVDGTQDTAISRVKSTLLDTVNRAANAGDILRDVLGVKVTTPEWVEEELNSVVDSFRGKEITREMIVGLRKTLSERGFNDYYPEAMMALTRS